MRVLASLGEPTGTEGRVLAAVAAGEELDLRVGDPERDDPQGGAGWDDARSVRAEFLYALCARAHDEWRVHARGLRLRGARITGELNLEAASVAFPLTLRDCWFDHPLVLSLARLMTLRLSGCHLPGITADQLETRGNLELDDGFHAQGEVRLLGAHIGGGLECQDATFANPNGRALNGYHMTVVGALRLRTARPPEGTVDLAHARVGLLVDAEASWPTALRLDGFVYDAIRAIPEVTVEQRLGWLARDPDGYSPQKYEQLAAVYRRAGQEQEAQQVGIAKQRARRQRLPRPQPGCGAGCWRSPSATATSPGGRCGGWRGSWPWGRCCSRAPTRKR